MSIRPRPKWGGGVFFGESVVCMIIAIILMVATLLVIKAVTAKKHAGVFAEMAEADKVLYQK